MSDPKRNPSLSVRDDSGPAHAAFPQRIIELKNVTDGGRRLANKNTFYSSQFFQQLCFTT